MDIQQLYSTYSECDYTVCTDTRNIIEGSMFFALKGANFNGNEFAIKALELGARYAVVDEEVKGDERIIKVGNVLQALQQLATVHRRTLGTRLLGIAGSNGKTTTKELIVSVLAEELSTHYTFGNLNNHIGVPLTLLQLRPHHEVAVVELGANREKDIEELCGIAEPDLGIITNIGKEHLQGFGSIEGVARAEGELFDYLLQNNGHAFVNDDDQWLVDMSSRLINKNGYSIYNEDFHDVTVVPDIRFKYKGEHIHSILMGEHNLQNIAAAIAVAEYFEVTPHHIKKGIESYEPKNNRSQLITTDRGNTVLLDAYNANPSSVEMALHTFSKMRGEKIVLLGDMFELGDHEAREHQHIADVCIGLGFFKVYLIGEAFSKVHTSDPAIVKHKSKEDAMQDIHRAEFRSMSVLIKGSRGMRMEDFIKEL